MATDRLHVTFQGPRISETGVSLNDLEKTFNHLQKALWLMVSHLEDATTPSGRLPAWVRRVGVLRLMGTAQGSLVAELGVSPSLDYRSSADDVPQRAIDRIMRWHPEDDDALVAAELRHSEEGDSLPALVAAELRGLGADLSQDVANVRLHDPSNGHHIDIPRQQRERTPAVLVSPEMFNATKALLFGRLQEVDWDTRTARLGRHEDRPVQLRFNADLDEDMHRLARQYVEVRGQGRLNRNDQWASVQVDQISSTRSGHEPFDLDTLLNSPDPKIFRSDEIVRAREPFDVDEFNRLIREDRDL